METKKETVVPTKEKIPESPQPGKTSPTREPRIPESPENNPPKPLPEKVTPTNLIPVSVTAELDKSLQKARDATLGHPEPVITNVQIPGKEKQEPLIPAKPPTPLPVKLMHTVQPEPVKPSWDKPITVVAAIIQRGNSVLISQRKSDEWSAGKWEFPGGKIEKDESEANAIRREMREELGVDGDVRLVHEVNHQYPGCAPIKLKYYRVLRLFGEPYGAEGQEIRWVPIPALHDWNLLDANRLMLGELERGHI